MSRVPGGVGAAVLVGCLCGRVASRFLGVAGGYWRVKGEGLFLPPLFFVAAGVPLGWGGGERWRLGFWFLSDERVWWSLWLVFIWVCRVRRLADW